MKISGIYKITSPSKKIYIGQAVDILGRWVKYKNLLCKGQSYLYNSLVKYGFDKHKFEVICQCDRSELNNLEKYYIALFQCFNSEYGLNLKAGGEGGGIYSKEAKENMRKAKLGKKRNPFTEEHKTNMRKAKKKEWDEGKRESFAGEKNPFFGKHHTEETNRMNSEKNEGKHHSKNTEFKVGMIAPNKGRKRMIIDNKIRYIA